MERSIKRNLELASDKSKYDTNAKNLLSEKDILAYILQPLSMNLRSIKLRTLSHVLKIYMSEMSA